ncbi:hypothetical protein [Methanoculleus methanifontis]|uniref:hypothetical protein n=1 Tax=Methanoculleus methanifontis TaxID=2584086 RepID=UPI0026587725|nr:hypothetical protein [Methanoculleus sp. FWC-SCC3]
MVLEEVVYRFPRVAVRIRDLYRLGDEPADVLDLLGRNLRSGISSMILAREIALPAG